MNCLPYTAILVVLMHIFQRNSRRFTGCIYGPPAIDVLYLEILHCGPDKKRVTLFLAITLLSVG